MFEIELELYNYGQLNADHLLRRVITDSQGNSLYEIAPAANPFATWADWILT